MQTRALKRHVFVLAIFDNHADAHPGSRNMELQAYKRESLDDRDHLEPSLNLVPVKDFG